MGLSWSPKQNVWSWDAKVMGVEGSQMYWGARIMGGGGLQMYG